MGRKKKRRTRRKNPAVNVLALVEGYSYASIWSDALFKTTPLTFLLGDQPTAGGGYSGSASGENSVSLKELITGWNTSSTSTSGSSTYNSLELVRMNAMNNWGDAAIKSVLYGVGWRVAIKATAPARRKINGFLRKSGLGQIVKV